MRDTNTLEKSRTWRARAEECRELANRLSGDVPREKMRQVAVDYERMAEEAERKLGLVNGRWLHSACPAGERGLLGMKKRKDHLPEWRVTMIRAKGQALGRVRARTADEAIETAIREFGIDKAHQNRLIATRAG